MKPLFKLLDLHWPSSKKEAVKRNDKMNFTISFGIDPILSCNLQVYAVVYNMEKFLPNVDYFIVRGRKFYTILCYEKDVQEIKALCEKNNWFNHLYEDEGWLMYHEMETWH